MATDKEIKGLLINIGPGPENEITVNTLFKKLSNILQFNKEPVYMPSRVNEVKDAICSSNLSEKILNSKSNKNIDDILINMCENIKKRGVKKFIYNYNIEIENELTPDTWKKKLI